MTNHLAYELALQKGRDRTASPHTRAPEPVIRRRAARTLRRFADGLDGGGLDRD